ncbi:MAG: nucleotidyltransferase domain-containing protein [Candidatus Asgardarchaeia archaeon]
MIDEFRRYRGFRILELFIKNPESAYNINEVARQVKVSTETAKRYVDILMRDAILRLVGSHNEKRVQLNDTEIVRRIKSAYMLQVIKEKAESVIKNPFYVFGSVVKGTYGNESDIDIFVIKINDYDKEEVVDVLVSSLNRPVNIIEVRFDQLSRFKRRNRELINEIKSCGLLFGDEMYEF